MAARQGFAKAQYSLGKAYRDGAGVEKSEEMAAAWFMKAAERGHLRAQRQVAFRLNQGKGLPRDDAAALKWALIAANRGVGDAAKLVAQLNQRLTVEQITMAEQEAAAFRPE